MAEEKSASSTAGTLKPTLGLTGLTSNAMALIAPGAFLWLTFSEQSTYGSPSAGAAMWMGMLMALILCLATAVAYAELSKLYPGAGSSYFFAEQAFLSKKASFKWARVYKYMVGWASHLYYWVYPGVMVCVTALFIGYMAGVLWPDSFSTSMGSPPLMIGFCVIFSLGVSYIAFRGVAGSTGVNVAINIIQITALIIFSCMAIAHRVHVKEGDLDYALAPSGMATPYVQDSYTPTGGTSTSKTYADGSAVWVYFLANPDGSVVQTDVNGATIKVDPTGHSKVMDTDPKDSPVQIATNNDGTPVDPAWTRSGDNLVLSAPTTQPSGPLAKGAVAKPQWNTTTYEGGMLQDPTSKAWTFNYHDSAKSVVAPHQVSFVIVQMGIAILCLVGFESVSSMGEEAKNPKKHIPWAIILSLLIQGGFCYMFEYFAANYFQSSSYQNTTESGSSAPIGDMMQMVGAWAFGSPNAGWWFVFVEAITVFLALIGTTLSCINTGARVTYAMGRDEEVPNHFGLIHGKNNTPHRCIWTLAIISIVIGIFGVIFNYCGPAAVWTTSTLSDAQKASFWYKGVFHDPVFAGKIPCSLLIITLVSNFGTFMLYMMSCLCAIVAYHKHPQFNFIKHMFIPAFGLIANLGCMIFYLVGPFVVPGMSKKEPFIALGVAAVWGIYGAFYFLSRSKKLGKAVILTAPPTAAAGA